MQFKLRTAYKQPLHTYIVLSLHERVHIHWCQLKKKARIFKKEERRLQREKKAKIG